jgi:hypothetical protein
MTEPENQTQRLLRELRERNDSIHSEMREGFENISDRLKNLQQAMIGESVSAILSNASQPSKRRSAEL